MNPHQPIFTRRAGPALSALNTLIALIAPGSLIIAILFLGLNFCRGVDITDESFYILSAQQPEQITGSTTQFGFYTGLLFHAISENLFLFRLAGLAILLLLTGLFVACLEKYQPPPGSDPGIRLTRLSRISAIFLGTLSYYKEWMVTPSYNFLALSSILLTLTGLLGGAVFARTTHGQATPRASSMVTVCAAITGLGGGLSLMAKPTTALVLAVTALIWIFASSIRTFRIRFLTISSCSAVLMIALHGLLFEPSLQAFVTKLQSGLLWGKLLGGGHTLSNLTAQAINSTGKLPGIIIRATGYGLLITAAALFFRKPGAKTSRVSAPVSTIILVSLITIWFLIFKSGYWSGGAETAKRIAYGGLSMLTGLWFLRLFFVNSWWVTSESSTENTGARDTGLILLLIAASIAYSYGSNIGFIKNMSASMVFMFSACLVIATKLDQIVPGHAVSRAMSALLSISIILILHDAYHHPQRIPGGIPNQSEPVTLSGMTGTLLVDPATKHYIDQLQNLAWKEQWAADTPLIDLTGGTPAAAVILGATAPGIPWLIGGYPGSNRLVETVLSTCDEALLKRAWVLTAPGGERRLSESVVNAIGLDFPDRYRNIGTLTTSYRNEPQILWKPRDD